MRNLIINLLLKSLKLLKYEGEKVTVYPDIGVKLDKQDRMEDIWFRAVVIANEINRNKMGYEPNGWGREQLVTRLVQEYEWVDGQELTKIVNGVMG